ncbi:MAG: glycosyltransferase family 4 protein [Gemmatimonadaceae bacterium]
MRLLFLHTGNDWAGTARAFASAARGLTGRGHQTTVACVAGSVVEARASRHELDVIPLPTGSSGARDAWRLRGVLQQRTPDAVFVHSEREQLVVSSAVRLASPSRVVRRISAGAAFQPGRASRIASRMASATALFNSEQERNTAAAAGLEVPSAVAPLGVDVAAYDDVRPAPRESVGAPSQSRLVVCVFEPSARARMSVVLRTMAQLAPRHPELRLAVVGPGSSDENLRMHAAALGITNVVSFLGERDDELAILASADVGWVAANCDAAAFAYMDLMALRIPLIAEREPLAQHYVADGITGVLIPPSDAPETAALVATFLAKGDQRAAMGNAARARVAREFPESVMIEGFERAVASGAARPEPALR